MSTHAAGVISLFEYAVNRDGVVSTVLPPGSTLDLSTGLGSVNFHFDTPGIHHAGFFVDAELDELLNTFFNEVGSTSLGSPPAGLHWEIDEPGFATGDIYSNFVAGTLDNAIGISPGGNTTFPDDVAMALDVDLVLAVGETAEVRFLLSDNLRSLGGGTFHLKQFDPDSGTTLYLSSSLQVQGGPVIPEPAVGLGGAAFVLAACGFGWRRARQP